MVQKKQAFTLVELIVSTTILVILASIGFNSYIGYLPEARDAERKANMGEIKSSLKLYKQKRGSYPTPGGIGGEKFQLINGATYNVATQGKLNNNVTLSTMDKIPLDPYTKNPYNYSITRNKQEYQVALTLENGEFPISLLDGDYRSVSKTILPTIMLAYSGADLDISNDPERNYFIFDGGKNLPYNLSEPFDPYYSGEDVDDVLSTGNINFWQNSDYRSCTEIQEAAKFIHDTGTETYQIIDSTGELTNTGCTL